ncbi:MAG: hypothetical protein KF823_14995 [Xanthomonadales bacterium]|nr:hypothetical protein [Xanthomonadales bacterium]
MSALLGLLAAALAVSVLGNVLLLRRLRRPGAAAGTHAPATRALVEQAAAEERARIHADLHDDLGARLLEMVYAAPDQDSADRARALLQDLRDMVTRARGEPGTLGEVLADIQAEARRRLAAVDAGLAWQQPEDLPDPALDSASALHLRRIVREAISNALHHGGARSLRVRVQVAAGPELLLELTDDGSADLAGVGAAAGSGVRNMRDRARALDGEIDWRAGTLGGTKVLLRAPLPGGDGR